MLLKLFFEPSIKVHGPILLLYLIIFNECEVIWTESPIFKASKLMDVKDTPTLTRPSLT